MIQVIFIKQRYFPKHSVALTNLGHVFLLQVKLAKDRKKGDKIVTDSQERAYWRVYRPPPGFTNCLETAPVPDKTNMANRVRKKTIEDLKKEVRAGLGCSSSYFIVPLCGYHVTI